MYTLCTINEEPLQAETYPKLKSITHLCTFSDIGVYVAIQLILIIVVSDQWYQVLIPYSCRQALGLFYMLWDGSPNICGRRAMRDAQSPMLEVTFLHRTIIVAQPGFELQTFAQPGLCV